MGDHSDIDHTGVTGVGGSVATDAIWDAKGDLAGGTGANTAARLAVGTNGHVLTADSAEATGMKWAASGGGAALTLCLVRHSTTQSRATNSVFLFDTDMSDVGNWHDTSSNTSRIVVPATGVYLMWFGSFSDGNPGNGPLYFRVNNTTNVHGAGVTPMQQAGYHHTMAIGLLTASDYVEVRMGGSATVNWGHATLLDAMSVFGVVRLL